jgi:hypothetical protein
METKTYKTPDALLQDAKDNYVEGDACSRVDGYLEGSKKIFRVYYFAADRDNETPEWYGVTVFETEKQIIDRLTRKITYPSFADARKFIGGYVRTLDRAALYGNKRKSNVLVRREKVVNEYIAARDKLTRK